MVHAGESAAAARQRLAALVKQQRAALGWGKGRAAAECGIAPMTYVRVEAGETVRDETYTRIEGAFHWKLGACHAVLAGAETVTREDGSEITVGAQAVPAPVRDVRGMVVRAVEESMFTVAPGLTLKEARQVAEGASIKIFEVLRESGILDEEDDEAD